MIAVLLSAVLAAAPGRMAFAVSTGWVITDGEGAVVERINALAGRRPIDLAISADGKTVVFTAAESGRQPGLYRWDGKSELNLSVSEGYHAAPDISPDGRQVIFAHHPGKAAGPPGAHGPGQNAQLWRIGIDGENAKQLTDSRGCKGQPSFAAKTVLLNHSTCRGMQGIEELRLAGKASEPRVLVPPKGIASEPRESPNGVWLAYAQRAFEDTTIVVSRRSNPSNAEVIATFRGTPKRLSLRWSSDSRRLFYVAGDVLHRTDRATRDDVILSSFSVSPEIK